MTKSKTLKQVLGLYLFIFLVWGIYRYFFQLPPIIEQTILKPLIWLLPLFWLIKSEKKFFTSIGWSLKNLFKSLYLGIGLGIVFAFEGLLINNLKYGEFHFTKLPFSTPDLLLLALGLAFVGAISEETVFRGFIFTRLQIVFKNEWLANILSSVAWTLIHLPVALIILQYPLEQMAVYLLLVFIFGFASCLVYGRTGTIAASILLNVFWSWPINLFR
ncbi:hypothetical protein COT44_01885 [Candidatus Shapirobacteria bacterium CG08_land_8_20_14_0_20_39_18]|uniref:CAAX prenyl protease 2/Lysostaphin resistance protein A-like domain-containing protein n=1 Tax=Candidatus Shapirobacteria bacterium CG08_land_8_20_14_0_20_39_18 TaxID=1974883 RepID=A0A2M6XDF1_9BACT|nr:MAG: hypothetical protein COT44_01885 [Candidatus Shapirobacteria bacterium CG08_land_8_20_14_0_20_39_18]PIY64785.1 MAG: hypothetical protein COY91_04300 [Candidatus Shapirobacteria bacterium CG_4_10_14_0_8_um_filter_39_15]PJE67912.1 MAG: hypothetical protein COU94_04745 [Candidatus Shapirobacteria bacterium CG10_big_fil_rev_8_21_14_0_10_38_8]